MVLEIKITSIAYKNNNYRENLLTIICYFLEGYVHELFTVKKIQNVEIIGKSSKKFSWFPGYAWTSIICEKIECRSHLGWFFNSSKLLPKNFYGIRRDSFKLIKEED